MLNRVVHPPTPVLNTKEWNHDYVKLSVGREATLLPAQIDQEHLKARRAKEERHLNRGEGGEGGHLSSPIFLICTDTQTALRAHG
jgi:hypothetical protein